MSPLTSSGLMDDQLTFKHEEQGVKKTEENIPKLLLMDEFASWL